MKKKLLVTSVAMFGISVIIFLTLLFYYFDSIAVCMNNESCSFAASELAYLGTVPIYLMAASVFILLLSLMQNDVLK